MKQFTLFSILFSLLFLFSSVLWANSYDAHIEQGNFFNDRGQTRKAHKEYLEAYAKASNQREQKTALASLAVTSLNLGNRNDSERYLREFLSISPNNQWAKRFAKQYNLLTNKAVNTKYRLTINVTPYNSRIRVMNIKPKYRSGILLKPGKYDIEVTHPGYESKRRWVEIENADLMIDVILNKLGIEKSPTILPRQTDITLDELGAEKSQTKKIFSKGNNISNTDNIALWQYALQLRKNKLDLFAGAQGVVLLEIKTDSPAEKNGLQRGDIIIAYAEQPINSVSQLANIVQANTTKQQVNLQFIRANTVQTVRLRDGQIGNPLAASVMETFSLVEWFEAEFITALQAQDGEKINQLFIDNPHLVSQYQLLLTRMVDKGTKEQVEWARNVTTVVEEFLQNIYFPPSYRAMIQLFIEGEKAYDIADYLVASEKWQAGLKRAHKLEHKFYTSQFLHHLGLVYKQLEQYPKAIEYFDSALTISRNIADLQRFGAGSSAIGEVYQDLEQYSKALRYYQQAVVIFRDIGNKFLEGHCLTNMGTTYFELGQHEKALEHSQQALIINRIKNRQKEGTNLYNIGRIYAHRSQYSIALNYYQQALAINREFNDKYEEGSILNNIGIAYMELGQNQDALIYLKQSLKITHEIEAKKERISVLGNIGLIYKHLGQYQKSLDYLQKALKIAHDMGDKPSIGSSLNNIGAVYAQQNQDQKALEYYQQGLAIFREIGSKLGEASSLGNIGSIYGNLGKTQEALTYHQQALALDEELGDKSGKGADLMNIGVVYIDLEQYQIALNHFQRSLKIMRDIGNKLGEAKNLDNIAKVYQSWGQYQKYSDYHRQALAIYREIDYPHEIEKDFNLRGDIRNPWYDNAVSQGTQNRPLYGENTFGQQREIGDNFIPPNISNHDDSGMDFYDKAFKIAGIVLLLLFIIGLTRSKTKTK
ncbi:Tetratricopeptide TPR_2 [Beggiatoa sp. PS]|nr:Tetratricopeptide TPR_2 [Beggiatoa sp. PS]